MPLLCVQLYSEVSCFPIVLFFLSSCYAFILALSPFLFWPQDASDRLDVQAQDASHLGGKLPHPRPLKREQSARIRNTGVGVSGSACHSNGARKCIEVPTDPQALSSSSFVVWEALPVEVWFDVRLGKNVNNEGCCFVSLSVRIICSNLCVSWLRRLLHFLSVCYPGACSA